MSKKFSIFEKPKTEKELNCFLKKSFTAVVVTVFVSAFSLVLMLLSKDSVNVLKFGFVALLSILLSMLAYFEAQLQLFQFKQAK